MNQVSSRTRSVVTVRDPIRDAPTTPRPTIYSLPRGGVAERFNAPVLKTGRPQALAGSNPAPSASVQGFLGLRAPATGPLFPPLGGIGARSVPGGRGLGCDLFDLG